MAGEGDDIRTLLARSERARLHASRLTDKRATKALSDYADELDRQIASLREERKSGDMPTLPERAANAPLGEPSFGPELAAAMKPQDVAVDTGNQTSNERYFFHVFHNSALVEDTEGIELPNVDAAKKEALATAREMAIEAIRTGQPVGDDYIEVKDSAGAAVTTLVIRTVLE